MNAISVKQPWACFIAEGPKLIETRKWQTSYRGDLLIVASRTIDWPTMDSLARPIPLILGGAICVANLVDCRPMKKVDEESAMCSCYPGAFSWVLEDIRTITPFAVKGRLRLFDVPYDLEASP